MFAKHDALPQARGDAGHRLPPRQLGQSETLIGLLAPKAPELLVGALLACALALITAPDANAPTGVHRVDQTVTAADAHPDTARASMVNAVLRRFLRERRELLETALQQPLAKWNYPQWWIDAARAAWPQQQQILAAGDGAPPLTLRVNRPRTVEAYLPAWPRPASRPTASARTRCAWLLPVGVALIPPPTAWFGAGRRRPLAAPLLDGRRHARSTPAPRPAARPATSSSWPTRP